MADMEKLEQRISELERRIQMQEDIRAIERLQANYWDCLDKKDCAPASPMILCSSTTPPEEDTSAATVCLPR